MRRKRTSKEKRKIKTQLQRERRAKEREIKKKKIQMQNSTRDISCENGKFVSMKRDDQLQSGACIYLGRKGKETFDGYGVFALVALQEGDIITKYEGPITTDPKNAKYAMQLGKTKRHIDGINQPEPGKGLGTFINKEVRKNTTEGAMEI